MKIRKKKKKKQDKSSFKLIIQNNLLIFIFNKNLLSMTVVTYVFLVCPQEFFHTVVVIN